MVYELASKIIMLLECLNRPDKLQENSLSIFTMSLQDMNIEYFSALIADIVVNVLVNLKKIFILYTADKF